LPPIAVHPSQIDNLLPRYLRLPPTVTIPLNLWCFWRAFTRQPGIFLLLSSTCALREERLSALRLVENLHPIGECVFTFAQTVTTQPFIIKSLVELMNKMCGVVVLAGLALSGCASKTPEKPKETPPPAVVQQSPAEVAHPTPAEPAAPYTVRYEAAPANANADAQTHASSDAAQPESETNLNENRAEQCRKELDVLKIYNKASYAKYEAEYQAIASKTGKYMQIKDSISSDINYMVLPAYQFQIREFCFRVKTRLSQLVLRQAKP